MYSSNSFPFLYFHLIAPPSPPSLPSPPAFPRASFLVVTLLITLRTPHTSPIPRLLLLLVRFLLLQASVLGFGSDSCSCSCSCSSLALALCASVDSLGSQSTRLPSFLAPPPPLASHQSVRTPTPTSFPVRNLILTSHLPHLPLTSPQIIFPTSSHANHNTL
ncbi:hypothetical protein CNYM01_12050 [Colletotrichum nymphaeae SA-01]|uniref:Uncharacterized protein n=1 Tax=Colletotrichum nymphaeae SA-01 TaxID=1460502 RepID=A0A135RYH9_9PEZI|nr:hypothetical protein CNYM01_12050 [Colletotrichum nymphaeae SA-01]